MSFYAEPRNLWHGKPTRGDIEPLQPPVSHVLVHNHTKSFPCLDELECRTMMRNLQNLHMFFYHLPDIRFNFLIGHTGGIYEGRGWTKKPDLPERFEHYTDSSIYIGFIGPGPFYDKEKNEKRVSRITKNMYDALEEILDFGVKNSFIKKKFAQISITRHEKETEEAPFITL